MKYQLRFGGEGGQGVITAGEILAEAAIEEGRCAFKCSTYTSQVRGGPTKVDIIIVIDPNLVHPAQDDFKKWKIYKIPIITIAKDEVGNVATQSVIALAIAAFMSECIDLEKLRTVMLETVPPKTKEANAKAFDLGVKYAKEAVAS